MAALNPQSIEGPIAVATTAIEARMYDDARKALQPLLASRLTQRVAVLMARLEAGENGDKGKVREWLARASNAAHDPVWIADGVISSRWEATSPIDGRLDAFQWRVPVEAMDKGNAEIVANRLEELLAIGSSATGQDDVSTSDTALHRDTPAKAIDVDAVPIPAESVAVGDRLRREGFVGFDEIVVADARAVLSHQVVHRGDRREEQVLRIARAGRVTGDRRKHLEPVFCSERR